MATISFFGATGTVTGSRFLLEAEGRRVLIDCGIFQGIREIRQKNWEPFPVEPGSIDAVLLTHAHTDHSAWLPRLVRNGFCGDVYCTPATHDLCKIMLLDSAHIHQEDARWANKKGFSRHKPALPLYTTEDAEESLKYFKSVNYGQDLVLSERLRFKFKDAGHILGSSMVRATVAGARGSECRILFGGDLGRPGQPILRDPVQAFEIDYLLLESTYGDRLHANANPSGDLANVINGAIERKGALIIPAFAVGRTQSLLYTIRKLQDAEKVPTLPIFVDSPMAINATRVFQQNKGDYDLRAKIEQLQGNKILEPDRMKLCQSVNDSIAINDVEGPAIIISASGMVTGGRILHHLKRRLPKQETTVLFIGYQGEGTRGRTILSGVESVKIHGKPVEVNAKIEQISGFSAHADYNEILAWLIGFNRPPKKTFLVHGEDDPRQALAKKIRAKLGWQVVVPGFGDVAEL
ncbi:MAG: MBL fold metallo-hydrolase [Lentisphaeria bacterium]|jgi:metallo-beta-lactamase family protein|nr:MBL fold metallo-hydrolase [Lentisphaeria bacterium]